jgi:hypothetical protein
VAAHAPQEEGVRWQRRNQEKPHNRFVVWRFVGWGQKSLSSLVFGYETAADCTLRPPLPPLPTENGPSLPPWGEPPAGACKNPEVTLDYLQRLQEFVTFHP